MKKRILIVSIIVLIAVMILGLYQTFASNIAQITDNVYNIELVDSNNNTISIPAKTSKTIFYKICNTNKGKVQYGVAYTSDNIIVKEYFDTIDPITGLIDYGENKFVKLKLINNSNTEDVVTLSVVLGYESGGDLIVPKGVTLVSNKISEKNEIVYEDTVSSSSSTILGTNITRENVGTITFEEDNIVPAGAISPKDISSNGDGSVMMWYTENSSGSYELHMGSDNGKVSITNGANLFAYMDKVESLDFSNVDLSELTSMENMFRGCTNLKEIKFGNNKLSNVTDLNHAFYETSGLTTIDLSGFDTSNVTNMASMFAYSGVEYLDLRSFDTSNVTSMRQMFHDCLNLKYVDFRSFDTSKVIDLSGMFYNCPSLIQADLSNFNTSNIKSTSHLFYGCKSLISADLSGWDTSKVTEMNFMFWGCESLVNVDISSFNTSNVTTMERMFHYCGSLTTLDLSNFNTANVTNMYAMFSDCLNLTTLNISSFNTTKTTNMDKMFRNDSKLTTIYVSSGWTTSAVTTSIDMFKSCTSLKGGANTKYNSSYIDKTYAKIDGGTSNPGYFTSK